MTTVDGLDVLRVPLIALPEDMGDGPFWMNRPDPNQERPVFAKLFRREEPFEETWLTDMPIFGKSDFISMGRLYINDVIHPNSFRRVNQHFRNEQSENLSGTPIIVFQGGSIAIIEEGLHALAPKTGGAMGAAQDALNAADMLVRPALSARNSSYNVRIRLPGFQPIGAVTTKSPAEVLCIDPRTPSARRMMSANTIDTFRMGNGSGDQKVYVIDYPVGRSIPLIFDIVNIHPTHSVVVDFTVAVLIDRRETNAR